jgi:signal transduction histidine kinase
MLGEQSQPRAWTVQLAMDPEFREITWQYHFPRTNLVGYPGRCAVVIPGANQRGRYLRLLATGLWGSNDQCGFGLAELQAYSGGRNVALGMPVQASDVADAAAGSRWKPEFAVDGFSSRHRLIEWPEYLDLITRRGALEAERTSLLALREHKLRTTGWVLGYSGSALAGVALLGWGWLFIRQRTDRQRAVAQLREQIARDLHDDIGSNLGGIVLLSEMGSRFSEDKAARDDFAAIKEAAEETSKSMEDMVWLIGDGKMGLRDLVIRMRQAAAQLIGDAEISLTVEPAEFGDRQLSLFFRRHVFFSYKEALNNIRRHANATEVKIQLTIEARHFRFEIHDNGVGFDSARVVQGGHGLANLQRRAGRLKGTCSVDSRPNAGTLVTFKAPLKS